MKPSVKSHRGNAFTKTKQKPQVQIQPLKNYLPSNYLSCKKGDIRKYTFTCSFVQKKLRQDSSEGNEIGYLQVVGTGWKEVGNGDRAGRDNNLLYRQESQNCSDVSRKQLHTHTEMCEEELTY